MSGSTYTTLLCPAFQCQLQDLYLTLTLSILPPPSLPLDPNPNIHLIPPIEGTPEAPRCGFSKTLIGLLTEEKIQFSSFDILGDEEIRGGLKTFSDWPTYPQLYAHGDFMGGLDIVKEMMQSGSLRSQLGI